MRRHVRVHLDPQLTQAVHELALEGFKRAGHPHYEPRRKYEWLGDLETRLWLDTGDAEAAEQARQAHRIDTGRDLVDLSNHHGVDLFRRWSKEDRMAIREKGKIPDVSRWPGVPVDDLMSISALESFAMDQTELDSRIEGLVRAG